MHSLALQLGIVGYANNTVSFKVTLGNSTANYIWISYVVFSRMMPNFTVLAGTLNGDWPAKIASINPNNTMYGQFGIVFLGISGFDGKSDDDLSMSGTIDHLFNLTVRTQTGNVLFSYLLLENNADQLCRDCPEMTLLEGSYCVAQCTPDSITVPFASLQKCEKCQMKHYRISNADQTECVCADNTYEDTKGTCKLCDYSCLTCNRTSCISCDTSLNYTKRLLRNGKCLCPNGFYDDGSSITCQPCHYTCQKCSGSNDNNCLSCSQASFRLLAVSRCRCPVETVDDGVNLQCSSSKGTCENGQMINGTCTCNEGFMNISGVCWKCPANSTYLADQKRCQCSERSFLINGACQQCPTNELYNSTSQSCVCTGLYVRLRGMCQLRCLPEEQVSESTGLCQCRKGFNRIKGACVECLAPRYFDGDSCQLCDNGRIVDDSCQCYSGYRMIQSRCVPLSTNMVQFEGSVVCQQGYFNISGVCDKCPTNQQYNSTSQACDCQPPAVKLSSGCLVLSRNESVRDGKLICNQEQGYRNISGLCGKCPDNSQYISVTQLCSCLVGFFRFGGACQSAPVFAQYDPLLLRFVCRQGYANTSNGCIYKCKDNQQVNSLNNGCQCRVGYFKIAKSDSCEKPGSHEVFSNGSFQCVSGYLRNSGDCLKVPDCTLPNAELSKDRLSCICKKGFYNITNKCQACTPNSNFNGSDCACNEGYELINGICNRLRMSFLVGTSVHQFGRIAFPIQLNYIPQLFLSNNCAACFLILTVSRKQGTQAFSTSFSYLPVPKNSLLVYLNFGGEPILPLTVTISINPAVSQYFAPYDTSTTTDLEIDTVKLPFRG